MQIAYSGDEALLTIGTGPDHGMIDISINDNYWRRFDAYATTPAERVIHLPEVTTPQGKTTGKLSIKVRSDNHFRSTGHVFRFKQLAVIDTTYNERTIDYTYDGLSRLQQANYDGGAVEYTYGYDLAGNLTNMNGATRTYNAANQLTNDGTHTLTYDPNGNLISDGTNSYTWDRANRLAKVDNGTPADLTAYAYDGLNNRISQSIGTTTPTVTQYLLDTQPGLTKVLAATTETNTNHYIHSVRGIHAQSNGTNWQYITQDGLGSVRSLIDSTLGVDTIHNYDPYGNYIGTAPTTAYFGFTGEQTDANGQLYLRARYYNPRLSVFNSLDPYPGTMNRPMSLNGYSYVEGNPIMRTDPSGLCMVGNEPYSEKLVNTIAIAIFGEIRAAGSESLALSAAAAINKLRVGNRISTFGKDYGGVFVGVCSSRPIPELIPKGFTSVNPSGIPLNPDTGETFAGGLVMGSNQFNSHCVNDYVSDVLSERVIEDVRGHPDGSACLMRVAINHVGLQLHGHCKHNDGAYWYKSSLDLGSLGGSQIASKVDRIYKNTNLRIAHTFDSSWRSQLDDLACCMRESEQIENPEYFDYVYSTFRNDGILVMTEDMTNKGVNSLQTPSEFHVCLSLKSDCRDASNPNCYVFSKTARDKCRGK